MRKRDRIKRDRIKLYPNHQHHWSEHNPDKPNLLQCDVCDLEMPRNVVEAYDRPDNIDPYLAELRAKRIPVTDKGVAT